MQCYAGINRIKPDGPRPSSGWASSSTVNGGHVPFSRKRYVSPDCLTGRGEWTAGALPSDAAISLAFDRDRHSLPAEARLLEFFMVNVDEVERIGRDGLDPRLAEVVSGWPDPAETREETPWQT